MTRRADPVEAFGRGSVADVVACFAPDATIWHNFDRITLTPEQNIAGLETLFSAFAAREYRELGRRRHPAASCSSACCG
jgi:hypothetical protein